MTLKFTLENLDGIESDEIKGLYKEADGKFVLDVEGAESTESVNGLKTALVKERENNGVYKALGTPDEIKQKFTDLEARAAAKGGKDEDHEKIVADLRTEFEGKLSAKDEAINGLRKKSASDSLKSELAKANFIPDDLDMVSKFAMGRVQFQEDGTPKIMTADGSQPMIGSGANGGATFEDLAKEMAISMPRNVKDGGKGGSGTPPPNGGKQQSDNPLASKVKGFSDLPVS